MPDTMLARTWTPNSWRDCPIRQVPAYPDPEKLASMEARIGRYPPLVFAGEARRLTAHLAAAAEGKAFVLQGGDCATSSMGRSSLPRRAFLIRRAWSSVISSRRAR
jgi:3-deoxy-7-phosphoheptulonate synthase